MGALLVSCGDASKPRALANSPVRVVTLAPNLTELVYAVGAGDSLVGVSAWSDYPLAARDLPVIGDAFTLDQEQLALLEPDLLLVWESGTPLHTIQELRKTGFNVAVIRTRGLADIAAAMQQIGELTGRGQAATDAANRFRRELQVLREAHRDAEPISVFFQVSARPLYTVNKEHYVSELIELCGGRNIFSDLDELAPAITVEAVVERNPEVMLASSDAGDGGFVEWQRWPQIAANLYGNLFVLPADELARATPRLISAGGEMCLALQKARFNRAVFRAARPIADPTVAGGSKALPGRNQGAPERVQ
jgi:iron complex transport system substrate-binding protein